MAHRNKQKPCAHTNTQDKTEKHIANKHDHSHVITETQAWMSGPQCSNRTETRPKYQDPDA